MTSKVVLAPMTMFVVFVDFLLIVPNRMLRNFLMVSNIPIHSGPISNDKARVEFFKAKKKIKNLSKIIFCLICPIRMSKNTQVVIDSYLMEVGGASTRICIPF